MEGWYAPDNQFTTEHRKNLRVKDEVYAHVVKSVCDASGNTACDTSSFDEEIEDQGHQYERDYQEALGKIGKKRSEYLVMDLCMY